MSRTFCRMDAWSNDERMAGPKWNAAQLIGKSQKGRYEHEKDLNHLPTKSNLTLLKCHVVSFTENFYTPYPQMPWSHFYPFKKKGMGSHRPHILVEKKKHPPQFFVALDPPNLRVPKISFPVPVGWWKQISRYLQPGVLCHWRMGPSLPGRKKEWQCQGHDHRGICDVIGVLKFQRDLMGDLIDSLAGPKYVHVNVFVCVCVLKYMYVHISILYIYILYIYIYSSLFGELNLFHQVSPSLQKSEKNQGFRLGKKSIQKHKCNRYRLPTQNKNPTDWPKATWSANAVGILLSSYTPQN